MEKIKILHINTGLVAGGVERLLNDLLPLFNKENNVEVDLFLLENKGNNIFEEELKKNKVNIIYSKYNNKFDISIIFELRKLIQKYDIVHTHIFPSQFYIPLAILGLKKLPYLITTEHSTENNRRKYRFLSYLEKYLYFKYDKIISISKQTEINLKRWLKVSENKGNKFITIENGINLEKFYPENVEIEVDYFKEERKKKIITMIGRFDVQKDQPTLIKAIKDIPDIYLFLVGDGPRRKEYENLVKKLKIEDKVKFLGVRKDIPKILNISDICVLSSNWEGFGLVAVEAMAAKKPIIGSKVDGLKQIIDDDNLIFNKGNIEELENKLKIILKDNVKYNEIIRKQNTKVINYSIDIMLKKYLKEYNNGIKNKKWRIEE